MTFEQMTKLTVADIRAAFNASGYSTKDELGREGLMSAEYNGVTGDKHMHLVSHENDEGDFETATLYVWIDYTPKGMIVKADF